MSAEALITVADGPIQVEMLPEVGARLHRLRVFGRDLLRTPDDPAEHARAPLAWGAYVMAPWCNRIAAAPTEVGGHLVALASNFEDGSAIHGQVYDARWQLGGDGVLRTEGGGNGWPWPYACTLHVTIEGAVLTIVQSLTNRAADPMPAGVGLHPWFRRPLDVRIDAQRVIPSNLDPAAEAESVAGRLDLRELRAMPDRIDGTWLDPGDPAVELRWPDAGIRALVSARSEAGLCVVAASPSGLDAVAIEPQTHAPQGLRRFLRGEPAGLTALAPGATLELATRLAFERS